MNKIVSKKGGTICRLFRCLLSVSRALSPGRGGINQKNDIVASQQHKNINQIKDIRFFSRWRRAGWVVGG